MILVRFLHRADGVKLVLLSALSVQLALLRGELGRQRLLLVRLWLGVARGRRRGDVVGMRGLLVRVVGVALLVLSAWMLLLLLRVVL